ncbi:unnamed protein product, partial [Chrysoparadoxa australica]
MTSEMPAKRRGKVLKTIIKGGPARDGAVCITSYGLVASNPTLFAPEKYPEWSYVMLDEGHKIKNPSTATSKGVHSVPAEHRLLITGTPIQNNLKELWALVDWCSFGGLLGSYKLFCQQFSEPIEAGQCRNARADEVVASNEQAARLWHTLAPYLLQRKKAQMKELNGDETPEELPCKTEVVVWVSLSQQQRILYLKELCTDKVGNVLDG